MVFILFSLGLMIYVYIPSTYKRQIDLSVLARINRDVQVYVMPRIESVMSMQQEDALQRDVDTSAFIVKNAQKNTDVIRSGVNNSANKIENIESLTNGKSVNIAIKKSGSLIAELRNVGVNPSESDVFVKLLKRRGMSDIKNISLVLDGHGRISNAEMQMGSNYVAIKRQAGKMVLNIKTAERFNAFKVVNIRVNRPLLSMARSLKFNSKSYHSLKRAVSKIPLLSRMGHNAKLKLVFRNTYESNKYIAHAKVLTSHLVYVEYKHRGKSQKIYSHNFGRNFFDSEGYQVGKTYFNIKPVRGRHIRMSSGYGYRVHPVTGRRKLHNGIDYAAPRGTPVLAAASGYIKKASYNRYSGRHIVIKHDNGYRTSYAHLSNIKRGIRRGVYVDRGTLIGRVGSSGRSTGSHLHFSVKYRGRYINPYRVRTLRANRMRGTQYSVFAHWKRAMENIANRRINTVSCKELNKQFIFVCA